MYCMDVLLCMYSNVITRRRVHAPAPLHLYYLYSDLFTEDAWSMEEYSESEEEDSGAEDSGADEHSGAGEKKEN